MKRSQDSYTPSSSTDPSHPSEEADATNLYDPNGPFEEFGEDSSDSDLSEEDNEDDEDDIYALPEALLGNVRCILSDSLSAVLITVCFRFLTEDNR